MALQCISRENRKSICMSLDWRKKLPPRKLFIANIAFEILSFRMALNMTLKVLTATERRGADAAIVPSRWKGDMIDARG